MSAPYGTAQAGSPRSWDLLARAAAAPAEPTGGEPVRELLAFELAGAAYAVPVERVREIVRLRALTPVPRSPDWMCGVIVLRGEVVQVLDLRKRIGVAAATPDRRARVVVLHGPDGQIAGVLVDAVRAVIRPFESSFRADVSGEGVAVGELCRHEDELVSVLELERVLEFDGNRG